MEEKDVNRAKEYSPAEIGALAHLYRGEMYQSKVWRTRLDTTVNWAIVSTGIALSVSFSNANASPVPILLVSLVVIVFLLLEAHRYMYYDLFRVRLRVMEINFYGPLLRGEGTRTDNHWNDLLADDYKDVGFHMSLIEALGRRIRRIYGWLFTILLACYIAKVFVHPTPLSAHSELLARAAIGPIPGEVVLGVGLLFHGAWIAIAFLTLRSQKALALPHRRADRDSLLRVAN
ncbi:MAG: DUF2270 domain-containing protein [Rhodoplanes sp.]